MRFLNPDLQIGTGLAQEYNYVCMKRNVNIIILTFEIAAIIILHAVKLGHAQESARKQGISKIKASPAISKRYQLLSIK